MTVSDPILIGVDPAVTRIAVSIEIDGACSVHRLDAEPLPKLSGTNASIKLGKQARNVSRHRNRLREQVLWFRRLEPVHEALARIRRPGTPLVVACEVPTMLRGEQRWALTFFSFVLSVFEATIVSTEDVISAPAYDHNEGAFRVRGRGLDCLFLDQTSPTMRKFATGSGASDQTKTLLRVADKWDLPAYFDEAIAAFEHEQVEDELEAFAMMQMCRCAWEVFSGANVDRWHNYEVTTVTDVLRKTARVWVPSSEIECG